MDPKNSNIMSTSERREQILSILKIQGSVEVSKMASMFSVSTVTIRNDLASLEKKGILTRAYGGAYLNEGNVALAENSMAQKEKLHESIKEKIGKFAATLIHKGDSIILDSGTTTAKVVKYLEKHEELIAMTNGLNVANELTKIPSVKILLTGGSLRRKSLSFYGSQAEKSLEQYHFNKLFLGVDGFHIDGGITTHKEPEALLNRVMCKTADEVIVLADSSKFGKIGLHKILDSKNVNKVVTDRGIPEEYLTGLTKLGVEVFIVD